MKTVIASFKKTKKQKTNSIGIGIDGKVPESPEQQQHYGENK